MILEAIIFRSFTCSNSVPLSDTGNNGQLSDLNFASCVMITLLIVIIYLILVFVALYGAFTCNKDRPLWMVANLFICVFSPTLWLLTNPTMTLAHRGPKSYCDTD
jgi:hypothetical protein